MKPIYDWVQTFERYWDYQQYRLKESGGQTTLSSCHRAIGELDARHMAGVTSGWEHQLDTIAERASSTASGGAKSE